MTEDEQNTHKVNVKILAVMRKLIQGEDALRQKYGIKDALKFVPVHLKTLFTRLENELATPETEPTTTDSSGIKNPQPHQIPVYIYLYHAKGHDFRHWHAMLTQRTLHDIGITRPIYQSKTDIEAFMRERGQQSCYAYLTAYVDKQLIIQNNVNPLRDHQGRLLLRIKENALQQENIVAFHHKIQGDFLVKNGKLIKIV